MEIKTTLSSHLTSVRMAVTKKTRDNECWWGCGEKGTSWVLLVGMQTDAGTMENSTEVSQKFKQLSHDPAFPSLLIYAKEMKTGYWRSLQCLPMFSEALFTLAKIWKKTKCLLRNEWIKKMWYACARTHTHTHTHIHTHTQWRYYSVMKKKEILPFSTTWMDPETL